MTNCDTNPLIPYDDALEQLSAGIVARADIIERPLLEARGAILAESIAAEIDVPGCAMSSMDGYAIRTADLVDDSTCLPVSQRIAAGESGSKLSAGTAARIFTGAPVPEGADAVIMQEQVEVDGDSIRFNLCPGPGNNIRPKGNDIKRGTTVLKRGCRLRPQDIGLAASVGRQSLLVYAPVKVGMFFTGDELVEPGTELDAGKIYDSNRYTLHGLLEAKGCEIVDLGLIGDTLKATREAMSRASSAADLVVTSGGVSVGEEDHVRIALEQLGELRLWRLGIKPGKPLAYGDINGTTFIGLPGNPVSVFATFCLFVVPVIHLMQGRAWQKPLAVSVPADFDWPKPDSRREFLRARLESDAGGQTVAQIYPNQDSGVLTSTVWADGFVEIAENRTLTRGEAVDYIPFDQFLG